MKNILPSLALSLLLTVNLSDGVASSAAPNYQALNGTLPGLAQRNAWAAAIRSQLANSAVTDQEIVRQIGDYSSLTPLALAAWIEKYNIKLLEKKASQQATQQTMAKVSTALSLTSSSSAPASSSSSVSPSPSPEPSIDDVIASFIEQIEQRERENRLLLASLKRERDGHRAENARLLDRIRDLEASLSSGSGGGGRIDSNTADIIQGLRAEIARLGGSTKAADAQTLPPLNSPFVYPVSGLVAFDIKTTSVAGTIIPAITGIDRDVNALIAKVPTFTKLGVYQKRIKATLSDLNAILANPNTINWDEFKRISKIITDRDASSGINYIKEDEANYVSLKGHMDTVARLQPAIQKEQEKFEYARQQNAFVEEFRKARASLNSSVQSLMATIPNLKKLKEALAIVGDAVLPPKIQTLINNLEKGDLRTIEFFLKEAPPPIYLSVEDLMAQGITRSGGDNPKLYGTFLTAWEKCKNVFSAIPDGVRQNVLSLYAIESGKARYANAKRAVNISNLPSVVTSNVTIVLNVDPFAITGEARTRFQDALNAVYNDSVFSKETTPEANAFRELYHAYNQVFDAASKLYFTDNPPQKGA